MLLGMGYLEDLLYRTIAERKSGLLIDDWVHKRSSRPFVGAIELFLSLGFGILTGWKVGMIGWAI